MEKLDLSKKYKSYYTATNKPEVVYFEAAQYLSISGKGDPDSPMFSEYIQTLYSTAYHLKFAYKAQLLDYVVPKLEAQWWFDETRFGLPNLAEAPLKIPRSEWNFRLLLRLPDFVKPTEVQKSKQAVMVQKQIKLANSVELFELHLGKCVQILHMGPFSTEPESLAKMQQFMAEHKLLHHGLHQEVYLSDFRKTEPQKLKTILREPVK